MHLAALKYNSLLADGGVEALSPCVGVSVCATFIWVGLGVYAFANLGALDLAIDRFVRTMLAMEQWRSSFLVYSAESRCPVSNMKGEAWAET